MGVCHSHVRSRRLARLDGGVLAVVRGALGDGLGLVAGGGALELLADDLDGAGAGARDGGRVAKVGVDARQDLSVVGLDVLDDDVALDAVLAVAAGAVELAKVDDGEAVDGHGALAVVLDDLVVGGLGAAALDQGVAVALEGEGVWEVAIQVSFLHFDR